MTPDQFAQAWEQHLDVMREYQAEFARYEAELAAMTDDSQPDVQPGADPNAQGIQSDAGPTQPGGWWSFDALAQSDSQPAEAYVWTAPIGPTPEQAKEAEQDRLWRLVVGTARGG